MIFESTQQLTVSLIQVFGGRENVDCGEGGMGRPGEGEGERGAHRDSGWTSILQTEAFRTFDLQPKRSLRKLQNEANGPWRINNMTLAY